MQNNLTIRRPVSPKKAQAVLHKKFHDRLARLSDADQGKLSIAIIEQFLRLDNKWKQQ